MKKKEAAEHAQHKLDRLDESIYIQGYYAINNKPKHMNTILIVVVAVLSSILGRFSFT